MSLLQDRFVLPHTHLLRQFEIPRVMIRGEKLSRFSWGDWDDIKKAFFSQAHLPLQQWWQEGEDANFQAGLLQIGWSEGKIYLFVHLEDASIVTTAQKNGERLWELGDAVEIFLKSPYEREYYELQVAPNDCLLQLKYPNADTIGNLRSVGMRGLEDYIITKPLFRVESQVEEGKWNILVEVPGELLFFDQATSLLGRSCQVSVSRYDYWADARPRALSSTSPHRIVDFHDQKDWGLVEFVEARPVIL